MDRFEIKTTTLIPTQVGDKFMLNNLLRVGNDKRTYFVKLKFEDGFTLDINGHVYETDESPYLSVYDLDSNDYIRIIKSSELRKDVIGTDLDQTWGRFIKSYNEYDISVSHMAEYHYTFVIDNKTVKKKRPKKEPVVSANEAEMRKKWIEHQVLKSKQIWNDVKLSIDSENFKELDEYSKLQYFQSQYAKFNKQHPLCIRFMVNHGKYNEKAFRRYMNKVANTKPGDSDEFLHRQADYSVYLYKETTPKWNSQQAESIWNTTYKVLKDETDNFKDLQDRCERIGDMVEDVVQAELREELQKQIEELRTLKNPDSHIMRTNKQIRLWDAYKKYNDNLPSSDEEDNEFN